MNCHGVTKLLAGSEERLRSAQKKSNFEAWEIRKSVRISEVESDFGIIRGGVLRIPTAAVSDRAEVWQNSFAYCK